MFCLRSTSSKGASCGSHQGRREAVTIEGGDPVELARRFRDEGARRLHLVDLDGAFNGTPTLGLVERVASAGGLPLQVGGGYRTESAIADAIAAGADRVMVGTAALSPAFLAAAAARFAEQLVVAIDVRDGEVAVDGWTRSSGTTAAALAQDCAAAGVRRLLVTSTARDGSLAGPDVELLGEVLLGRAAGDRSGRHLVDRRPHRGPRARLRGRGRGQRAARGPFHAGGGTPGARGLSATNARSARGLAAPAIHRNATSPSGSVIGTTSACNWNEARRLDEPAVRVGVVAAEVHRHAEPLAGPVGAVLAAERREEEATRASQEAIRSNSAPCSTRGRCEIEYNAVTAANASSSNRTSLRSPQTNVAPGTFARASSI